MSKDEALRLALETFESMSHKDSIFEGEFDEEITAIKAALEAKDEPWEKFCDSNCVWTDHHPDCKLAQRTWVGLTDEERESIVKEYQSRLATALIIEAKLKEKNT